uniref:Uncharacterized protein n=1 Tax=Oryza meridionalis TaxID=40149 RepID=A0A0E0CM11_9ORYZ
MSVFTTPGLRAIAANPGGSSFAKERPSPRKAAQLRSDPARPIHPPPPLSHTPRLSATALGGVVLGFQNLLDPSSLSPPPPSSAPIAAGSSPVS